MKIYKTNKKWLDIGCGNLIHVWCIWIDVDEHSKADIVWDIEKWLPFEDNTFEIVYCHNIMEHVKDVFSLFEEIKRVSKPWAILEIIVPHYSSRYAWGDLTHIRPFSYDSFSMYWRLKWFEIQKRKLIYIDAQNHLFKIILRIIFFIPTVMALCVPRIFERFFCYLFWGIDYIFVKFIINKS